MKSTTIVGLVILLATSCLTILATPSKVLSKVFNYEGSLPIRDDRTGELIKLESNETEKPAADTAEAEAACWRLINEESTVTFEQQNRVLDELLIDMKNLTMEDKFRDAVVQRTERMRENMKDAVEGLRKEAPDEFFDALFEASEDIIVLSNLLRDPKLNDHVFLTLVKAVSRLGRNNSALIQQFADMCSFVERL